MDNDPQSRVNPEKQILDDNARKFTCEAFDPKNLSQDDITSFLLITDWLDTNESSETKLAYKKFDNGKVQILLITKVTNGGKRTSKKQEISEKKYNSLLKASVLRIEKIRQEFTHEQDGLEFSLKYDDFGEGKLKMIEVDALNEHDRSLFKPTALPVDLAEVTGDMSYYGYRVAKHTNA